jgi:phage minor structural protein
MNVYLFDQSMRLLPNGVIDDDICLESKQKIQLNGTITHHLETKYIKQLEECTYFGMPDVDSPNQFWVYRIIGRQKQDGKILIDGIYKLFDDLKGRVIKDIRPTNVEARKALEQILDGTGWSVGTVNSSNTLTSNYYYQPILDVFWDAIDLLNVEFIPRMEFTSGKITGQIIDIADRFAPDYGRWYEYGDKLLKVEAESSEESIYTALIGRGKGEQTENGGFGRKILFDSIEWKISNGDPVDKPLNQPYVELPGMTELFGYPDGKPKIGVIDFDDCEDRKELLKRTYESLLDSSRPKVQFSAEVLETDPVMPGEVVTVIRDNLNIRYKTRVFEVERSYIEKNLKTIRFGDAIAKTSAERVKAEQKKQEKKLQLIQDYVNEMVSDFSVDFLSKDGYNYDLPAGNPYGLPSGIYSFDRPIDQNPTEVVGISAGNLVISNEKDSTGKWIFKTIANGDGLGTGTVGADQILAGAINTDHISAGGIDAGKITVGEDEAHKSLAKALEDLSASDQEMLQAAISEAQSIVENTKIAEAVENFNQAKAEYDAALLDNEQTQADVQAKLDALESAQSNLEAERGNLEESIRNLQLTQDDIKRVFATDAMGRPIISSPASSVSMVLDNDRLSIQSNGVELAYFGQDRLYITSGEMKELIIGRYHIYRSDGDGVSVDWI